MVNPNDWATELLLARVPYRRGGRDRSGLDCFGLVWLAFRERGIELPDAADNLEAYDGLFAPCRPAERQPWDVIRFFDRHEQADHIALVLERDTGFHISCRVGLHRFKIPAIAGQWRFGVLRYAGQLPPNP